MKDYPNREALRKAHDIYRDAMRQFIVRCLKRVRGERVEDLICNSLDGWEKEQFKQSLQQYESPEASIDIAHFPKIIKRCWSRDRAFRQEFNSNSKIQYKTGTIVESRNFWAHPGLEDVELARTQANLTLVTEVLGEIKNQDAKQAVETIRDRLFSDEPEEHPLEAENAAYKERLANMTKQLDAEKSGKTELEKQFKDKSDRLEEVEAEWITSEERLTDKSNLLESTEAENTELKKRLSETENRLKTVEVERAADQKGHRAASKESTSKPKSSIAEKFRAANTLEDRVEIGRKVAELRINASGSKGLAWRAIRERLGLKNDEFHKVVRLEDHFHESVVERIESFKDGWEYSGELESLLGFKPVGELANRIEACKPTPEEETLGHLPPNADTSDSITFQGTTFTKHLNKYHVTEDDISQSFWHYWHSQGPEGKQEMRDAGWSVEKVDGDWEVTISPVDFQAWIKDEVSELNSLLNSSHGEELSIQPSRSFSGRTVLPTGKEMEQPALKVLADGKEYRRVEIIDYLAEHFSLTADEREYLSKTGQAEKHLMNKGLIERTRTGYYRITTLGLISFGTNS